MYIVRKLWRTERERWRENGGIPYTRSQRGRAYVCIGALCVCSACACVACSYKRDHMGYTYVSEY